MNELAALRLGMSGEGHALAVFALAVGSTASLAGLLTLVTAMAPSVTSRAVGALRVRSFVCFLAGLAAAGVLLGAAVAAEHAKPWNLPVAALIVTALLVSLCASSEALGRRLALLAGRDSSRVSHLVWGWVTLALASMVPVVGWFIVLPVAVILGLGATLVGLLRRDEL